MCTQVALAHSLEGAVFAPSERMPKTNVFNMHRGIALVDGLVRGSGRVWGIYSILYSSRALDRRSSAKAFTYCEVLMVDGHRLRELADAYDPPTAKRIKTWAVFEMLKIWILRNLAAQRAAGSSPGTAWKLHNNRASLHAHVPMAPSPAIVRSLTRGKLVVPPSVFAAVESSTSCSSAPAAEEPGAFDGGSAVAAVQPEVMLGSSAPSPTTRVTRLPVVSVEPVVEDSGGRV